MKIKSEYQEWFDHVIIDDKQAFDQRAKRVTKEAYKVIDCLACAKCCLTTVTTFNKDDIQVAAKALSLSPKGFTKQFLFMDLDGNYTTQNVPCPFLNLDDHKCKIYESRPLACRSFPHTDRDRFLTRKKVHLENAKFCGITTYVLDSLKMDYSNFK